jgi:hypothetical protein
VRNAPASSISQVSLSPDPASQPGGALDLGVLPSVGISWSRLGGSSTLYQVGLWQERYFSQGGDLLLLNISSSGPVPALSAGSVAFLWQQLPQGLSSSEPVYVQVRAVSGAYAGSWGRSPMFWIKNSLSKTGTNYLTSYLSQPWISHNIRRKT